MAEYIKEDLVKLRESADSFSPKMELCSAMCAVYTSKVFLNVCSERFFFFFFSLLFHSVGVQKKIVVFIVALVVGYCFLLFFFKKIFCSFSRPLHLFERWTCFSLEMNVSLPHFHNIVTNIVSFYTVKSYLLSVYRRVCSSSRSSFGFLFSFIWFYLHSIHTDTHIKHNIHKYGFSLV